MLRLPPHGGAAHRPPGIHHMKPLGFLLLLAGWVIVLTAVVLLPTVAARTGFILAGLAVEGLGFGVVVRAHPRGAER